MNNPSRTLSRICYDRHNRRDRRDLLCSCRPHSARGLGVGAVSIMTAIIAGNRDRRDHRESQYGGRSGGGPRTETTALPRSS
jgi:hypothetical protein